MKPKATIMVPAYNKEDFIKDSIESALGQSYNGEWELLVVNDGSSDKTGKIAERYKNKFPSLMEVIHRENRGIGQTRNELLDRSKGDYIMGLDADDTLFPSSLEKVVDYFESYPNSSVVYTDHQESDRNGGLFKEMRKEEVHKEFLNTVFHHNFLGRIVAYNNEKTLGCRFDPFLQKSEDYDFLLKVLLKNWDNLEVGHIPEILYSYNREGGGLDDGPSKSNEVIQRNLSNHGFYQGKDFYVAKESEKSISYYEHFVDGKRQFKASAKEKLMNFLGK